MNKDSIKIKIIFNGKNLTVDVPKNKPFKIADFNQQLLNFLNKKIIYYHCRVNNKGVPIFR